MIQSRPAISPITVTALALLAVVLAAPAVAKAAESPVSPSSPYAVQPAFFPLRFGAVRPRGWILEQMRRDLRDGFAGHLDELCHEASSDIFATGRNRAGKPNSGNAEGIAWWNGETEGNWRCGHIMMACLTGEPDAMAKAKAYIEHILAAQEADGYLGIFSPELRYKGNGDLWAQTCLFRGLLAYADATGDEKVSAAVKRSADRTIEGYADCRKIEFSQHDAMFNAVLEALYARTGDRKYLDFGLRLFREFPGMKEYFENPGIRHADGTVTLNPCLSSAHGATVTESMRLPLWFWLATGDGQYRRLGKGAVDAMDSCILPSGALVSDELVNSPPRPWNVGYEYCTILERELTLLSAVQKFGDAGYADAAEHLWINAAQGSRTPDGTAVLYCSPENRLSVNDEIGRRQRFSPTHQQVAVCCNPNATRVAAYYTANSWMRPNGTEPAIAAMLYGPSELTADIAGTAVSIEERTLYPYSGVVELTVRPSRPVTFCLWLRNPSWSRDTRVVCSGAEIRLAGGFWQVRKKWNEGDAVTIRFDQAIREVPAINGELALQYGPLLYVLPVQGTTKPVKTYSRPGFQDYLMSANIDVDTEIALPAEQRSNGFGFTPRQLAIAGSCPDRPLDNPPVLLEGNLVSEFDGTLVPVQLVPMGAQSARLRRATFPMATANERPRPFGRFIDPGSEAAIPSPPDADPMFSHWLIGSNQPIACRFAARPDTPYQVFIGLNEAWWDKPGQRMMDIEIAGKIVATVDSFQKAKGTPSGYLFPAITDRRGCLAVRICPHPGAPDQNTVLCGVLLLPGDAPPDVDALIHRRGPRPLVTLRASNPPAIEEVIVVFKQHYDLGFWGQCKEGFLRPVTARKMVETFRTFHVDAALETCDRTKDSPPGHRFIWTVPGWPMARMAAKDQDPERLRRLAEAIRRGQLSWLANPFTTETEALELEDWVRGLGFSSRLSREFGIPMPRAANMTDVPEHTWAVATILRHAGIEFFRIGCNPCSSWPDVPTLFWWEGPDGSRVLSMYTPVNYGTDLKPPRNWPHKTWLWMHVPGDNCGSQSAADVQSVLDRAKREMPGVQVRIGELAEFFDAIVAEKPDLPVVRQDFGDTWIHGIMAMPIETGIARNLRPRIGALESLDTLMGAWGAKTPPAGRTVAAAYEKSLLFGEHTWGSWLGYDAKDYLYGKDWEKARAEGRYQALEETYQEHGDHIREAKALVEPAIAGRLEILGHSVKASGRRIVVFNPLPWKRHDVIELAATPDSPIGTLILRDVSSNHHVLAECDGRTIRFPAFDLPALGYRTFVIDEGESLHVTDNGELRADPITGVLENRSLRIKLDSGRGAIASMVDKGSGRELVAGDSQYGLGQYLYERFDDDVVKSYLSKYGTMDPWVLCKSHLPPAKQVPYIAASPKGFALTARADGDAPDRHETGDRPAGQSAW